MKRICVFTANRSEYAKLRPLLAELKHHGFDLVLIVSSAHLLQDFGYSYREIEEDGLAIDEFVDCALRNSTPEAMAKSAGLAMIEFSSILGKHKPDLSLVVGDRYDIFPAVLASTLMNVPIAHIQGGEISGSVDETLRHSITKLSHLHFVATELSRERVIALGEDQEAVFDVGCPSVDRLRKVDVGEALDVSTLKGHYKDGFKIAPGEGFLLMVMHPVTTEYTDAPNQIRETLHAIDEYEEKKVLLYPNIDAGSDPMVMVLNDFLKKRAKHKNRYFLAKHMPFEDYAKFLAHASCMVGNSSSGIREAATFGTPVVNIGSRQHGRERNGNVIDVTCEKAAIVEGIYRSLCAGRYEKKNVYGDGNASRRIVEILKTVDIETAQKTLKLQG